MEIIEKDIVSIPGLVAAALELGTPVRAPGGFAVTPVIRTSFTQRFCETRRQLWR